ncbi:MAG: response regulator [Oscillospiraceae bacterium]|nr:response regulator [Oscillospiraceae bacterium]
MYAYVISVKGQLVCLCVLLFIARTYFSAPHRKTTAHRLFSALIAVSVVNLVFDMTTVYTINHVDMIPMRLNHFFHIIFVSSIVTVLFIIFMYVRILAYGEQPFRLYWLIPLVLSLAAVTLLPFEYTVGEYTNHSSGPYATVAFVCGYIYCFLIMYILIRRGQSMQKKFRQAILISICIMLFVTVLQGIFQQLLISGVGVTIICVALFYTVESPDALLIEKLEVERRNAESANRAKSDFLANMSHEIRTPINAVLGMNEMILRESRQAGNLTDGSAEPLQTALQNIRVYAGDVDSAGQNLLAIINDILDFSKIEAGRMELAEAPYQLSSVLNDVSNMILFKAREKGLDFAVDADAELPDLLFGDEVRVRQVITNILNNAVKYTEHGSVHMTVRGDMPDGETLRLTVSVKDTGIGIRAEDLDRLFTKFQRLDMVRNSTVEGTGLGLVITQSLLAMMGGSIEVQSEYGKGSVFTAVIPQKILSAAPIGDFQKRFESSLREAEAYRETFRAPSARILIVDDTRMNLTVAISLLKDTCMQIDTAASGADAVALAEKTAYDVILMDQRMPEMDGTEALNRIRSDAEGRNCRTPVICLTADAVIGAKERYISEGFSDYLTKPINSQALEKMLMKHLPKEKLSVVRGQKEEASAGAPGETDARGEVEAFASLRTAEIDPAIGLSYCQNDEGFYRSILRDYALSARETDEKLRRYRRDQDWKNYGIQVHALKSTSKMIGAERLAGLAAEQEDAAGAGDRERISDGFEELMSLYAMTLEAIRGLWKENVLDFDGAAAPEFGEDGVLEFLPEEP